MNLSDCKDFSDLPLTLNVEDVAKILSISRATAYTLVHQKNFPKILIGKRIVIPREAFTNWIIQETCN